MLRFLEALNPCNFCFTVADFEDALIDIQTILKKIDATSKDCEKDLLSVEEKKEWLEKAFHLALLCLNAAGKQRPDKELSFLLADILRQYGTLCYEENYFAAKQILVLALNFHLYTIGIFKECLDIHYFTSLDELKKQSKDRPALFSAMEDSILSTNIDRCMTLAYTNSFLQSSPKKKLFSLAETVRWLGHCYQNIDQYNVINQENELRFSQLFGLSEALHLLNLQTAIEGDNTASHSLADLYYQAWPFMHQRKLPLDTNGVCQLYDKALQYDSSKEMQAQVANKRFLILFSNGQKSEALPLIEKAIFLAETLEKTEKNDFLLSNLYNNYAGFWMEPETLNLDLAEINLEKACNYATCCRSLNKDHLQFALYDMRFAEFKFVRGEFNAANEIVERALVTLKKYPQSQHSHLFKAEALKSLITKALKITQTASSQSNFA